MADLKEFREWTDDEFLRRMRAVVDELEMFDRQMIYKVTKAIARSADEVEQVTSDLCDTSEQITYALEAKLKELKIDKNACIFCALTCLTRHWIQNAIDKADMLNRRRVN